MSIKQFKVYSKKVFFLNPLRNPVCLSKWSRIGKYNWFLQVKCKFSNSQSSHSAFPVFKMSLYLARLETL